MPFRDKMKRAFGRSSEEENGLGKVSSTSSRKERKRKREYADNVYKPGEIMPKAKYLAPYNKDHQAKLSAFSFGDAWNRRTSDHSQYSPRGSRLPSLVGSFRRKSWVPGSRSRQPSHVDGMVEENIDGDDDVVNVGLSRQHTQDMVPRPGTVDSFTTNGLEHQQTATNGHLDKSETGKPFTEEELTRALTKTTIRP